MHFVPGPDLRWQALIAAVAYGVMLAFLFWQIAPRSPPPSPSAKPELVPQPIKIVLALLMAIYFAYVSFFITVPALITEAVGAPANREYVIEDLKQGSARALLCRYRLHLHEVTTVLDDTYCVSEEFARQHAGGETIHLAGTESRLGFRFLNVD